MSRSGNGIIGIRREDKRWEQRTPLTPSHVKYLIENYNLRVLVQPSNQRIYPNQAYNDMGAIVTEDLSEAGTILAVKEVPPLLLLPDRTYLFFSHTIKAQTHNMPLLDELLHQSIRFLDYETITEQGIRGGVRKVAFGYYAGIAGMIDFCRGLGERLLCLGYSTPFLGIASTYQYPDLDHAKKAITYAGECIQRYGLPEDICPFTIVVTSTGRVSHGAQDILNLLPVKWVHPFEFSRIIKTAIGKDKTHVIYCAIATAEHMVRDPRLNHTVEPSVAPSPSVVRSSASSSLRFEGITGNITPRIRKSDSAGSLMSLPKTPSGTDGSTTALPLLPSPIPHDIPVNESLFDKERYKTHPEQFEPIFHIKIAPYASAIVNCMYWESRFPRLLTIEQTRILMLEKRLRLIGIEDISCDYEGSIEFTREFTTIEAPFRMYDPMNDTLSTDMDRPHSILLQAVDHLPSECARDASDHFSTCLLPLLPIIARHKESVDDDAPTDSLSSSTELPPELAGAIICQHGKLTKNFAYIAGLREATRKAETSRGLRRTRNESFVTVQLTGHLFDQQIVNRALNIIEDYGASAEITNFRIGRDRTTPTQMQLQIFMKEQRNHGNLSSSSSSSSSLTKLLSDLRDLVTEMGAMMQMDSIDTVSNGATVTNVSTGTSILALPLAIGNENNSHRRPLPPPFVSNLSMFPALSPRQAVSRRILLLGAGHVSKPVVEYLLRRPNNLLTIGNVILSEAEALADGHARALPTVIDVGSSSTTATHTLGALIHQHDIVISLVPPALHVLIARLAIAHKRPMVTASYISPEMANLDAAAKEAGVLIVNEAGLDPGIDHMATMYMVDKIKRRKGTITSFVSVCGGLPAPEAANNPLGYKFSWSPKGAIGAMRNAAHYLRDGKVVTIPGDQLLETAEPYNLNPAYQLEVLPNRDSLPYADKYGIRSYYLRTMFRGTLRYKGYASKMNILNKLGFFSSEPRMLPMNGGHRPTAKELLYVMLNIVMDNDRKQFDDDNMGIAAYIATKYNFLPTSDSNGSHRTSSVTDSHGNDHSTRMNVRSIHDFLLWIGLFDNVNPAPLHTVPTSASTVTKDVHGDTSTTTTGTVPNYVSFIPLDTIVNMLTKHSSMSYASYERDMALMQHIIEAEFPEEDGNSNGSSGGNKPKTVRKERYTATLIEYAVPSNRRISTGSSGTVTGIASSSTVSPPLITAMARTVGYTAAIVTQLILDGKVIHNDTPLTGVVRPLLPVFYVPVLAELEQEGIRLHETILEILS